MDNRSYLFTPLCDAIKKKDSTVANKLMTLIMEDAPDTLTMRDSEGINLLQLAIANNVPEIFARLFSLQKENMEALFGTDKNKRDLLFYAMKYHSPEVAKDLLAIAIKLQKEQIGYKSWLSYDNGGLSLLHLAAAKHDNTMLSELLKAGANEANILTWINQPIANNLTGRGLTSLHLACTRNDITSIETLIHYGADISVMNNEFQTPLELIADANKKIFISPLAKNGFFIGKKIPASIAQELIDLAQTNDIILVGTIVNNALIKARKNCTNPGLAIHLITPKTSDSIKKYCEMLIKNNLASKEVKTFYYRMIAKYENLLTLVKQKIEFETELYTSKISTEIKEDTLPSDLLMQMPSLSQKLSIRKTSINPKNADSIYQLLVADKEKIGELIQAIDAMITNLPTQSYNPFWIYVIICFLAAIALVVSYLMIEKHLIDICQDADTKYNQAVDTWRSNANHETWAQVQKADDILGSKCPPVLLYGLFGAVGHGAGAIGLFINTAYLSRSIASAAWQNILDDVKNHVLIKLQFLETKEREARITNPNQPSSYLPIEKIAIRKLEKLLNDLNSNFLNVILACEKLTKLKRDLTNLIDCMKRTRKPISLFWQSSAPDVVVPLLPDTEDEIPIANIF